jgi:membrane peptidoglycan carboxypeptidase
MAYLKTMPELGKTVPERIKNITQGGLTIQTTLNPDTQKVARRELTAMVPIGNGEGIGAAASIIEPGTGRVIAMVQNTLYTTGAGSKKKGLTQLNWNVDRAYGGENGFQFGSTAKMYAIVTALENGIPVNGTIPSKFATPKKPAVYTPQEQGRCGDTRNWEVRNDEAMGGKPLPFKVATAKSVNTAFASLVLKLGVPNVQKTMTLMGLHSGSGDPITCGPASVTLGAGTTTPLTLATSYATLAADGKYCPPNPILSITTNDKKPLKLRPTACKQVIDPDIARGATNLLTNVVRSGTGVAAQLGSRPVAGKTGTTDNHYQSWFVGYTPQLATAVWVGTPYNQFRMKNISLAGHYYGEVFGGTISAPVWHAIMQEATANMPIRQFGDPSDKVLYGDQVPIPYVSGMSLGDAMSRLQAAGFSGSVAGMTSSSLPRGYVVYTSPSGSAPAGSAVGLYLSSGSSGSSGGGGGQPTPTPSKTRKHGGGGGGGNHATTFTFPTPFPTP